MAVLAPVRLHSNWLSISRATLSRSYSLSTFQRYTLPVSATFLFTIFDIDAANIGGSTYQDVISGIHATSTTGTQIAPTITNVGPNVSLTGTGLSQVLTGQTSTVDLGAGSGAANATISFNTANISSVTFTYGSSSMFADPTYQHIGIYNIDYEVVPEPGVLGACLIIVGLGRSEITLPVGTTCCLSQISAAPRANPKTGWHDQSLAGNLLPNRASSD